MAKVLVTGGAGFIGSNLTEALLKRGHLVRVLDNFSTGRRENLIFDKEYPLIEMIEGDIRDLPTCRRATKGIDYVFHQAALPSVQRSVEDPLTANSVNVEGTLNILFTARDEGVKRLIYASSSSVYGDTPTLPKREEMSPIPSRPTHCKNISGSNTADSFFSSMDSRLFPCVILISLAQNRTQTPFTPL